MQHLIDFLLMLVVVLGLAALAANRANARIRVVALQGVVLGALLIISHWDEVTWHLILVAVLSALVKGLAIPWLLARSTNGASGHQADRAYIGATLSLVLGAVALGVGFWLASLLPLPQEASSDLIVPVSLTTVFMGLLLLVSRRTATSQVLGYVLLENGTFAFSLALAASLPTLVEMGVLLDLFAAVFVMVITIYQIDREFDHIDASRLRELHDDVGGTGGRLFRPRRPHAPTEPR